MAAASFGIVPVVEELFDEKHPKPPITVDGVISQELCDGDQFAVGS
jgi:hypothetical protein